MSSAGFAGGGGDLQAFDGNLTVVFEDAKHQKPILSECSSYAIASTSLISDERIAVMQEHLKQLRGVVNLHGQYPKFVALSITLCEDNV